MTDIKLENLTNTQNVGVLDKLLSVIADNLNTQFSAGKITSTDYAKIYVNSLDSVLNQSIQFVLQKDISARQAELLAQQALGVSADIALTNANTSKVSREVSLLDKQEDLLDMQIALASAEVLKAERQAAILLVEKEKIEAEKDLVLAQINQANKQIELITAQLINLPKEGALLDKQVIKTQEETNLLAQRVKTETAQTKDTIDGVAVAGSVGKQNTLYTAQANQFSFDRKYKLLSQMLEVAQVAGQINEDMPLSLKNHLTPTDVGNVVSSCMSDIGVTPATVE